MVSVIIIITAEIMTLMSMSIGEYSPKPNASGKGPMKITKAPPTLVPDDGSEARKSVTNPIVIRRKPVNRSFLKLFKTPQP
ncbi:MAG: hypothetical protein FGF50_07140 [Candidatus Brockarchaeota archaeon]|nr:hypothetical protein [Candidatus Brockarchaeota archaeon]